MWEKVWNTDKIAYGGDYNPEQWPEDTWEEDMRLLKLAHIDTREFNTLKLKKVSPSLDTGLFFCQIFCFII